ncbi:MAG: zinc ribbon domain-containing protein [Firmicutes bacterium]|nr:zinc ribbon domain-containing protein [Bacillota bacterium]
MYCVNCGVKLADTESYCPLCGTTVYHPEIQRKPAAPLYAAEHSDTGYHHINSKAAHVIITVAFAFVGLSILLIDWQIHHQLTWSGIVSGAIGLVYILFVLPTWFKHPNPLVFAVLDFVAIGCYLLDVNQVTKGDWFLSLAFPVTGCIGAIVIAATTLLLYVKKGKLYVIGGAFLLLGAFMPLLELLIYITFDISKFYGWSIYPAAGLAVIGGIFLYLAINRHARETMERKFFI